MPRADSRPTPPACHTHRARPRSAPPTLPTPTRPQCRQKRRCLLPGESMTLSHTRTTRLPRPLLRQTLRPPAPACPLRYATSSTAAPLSMRRFSTCRPVSRETLERLARACPTRTTRNPLHRLPLATKPRLVGPTCRPRASLGARSPRPRVLRAQRGRTRPLQRRAKRMRATCACRSRSRSSPVSSRSCRRWPSSPTT